MLRNFSKFVDDSLKGGDVDRGHAVFFGAKAGCSSCHTIMADGGDVGPDLTGVGAIRSGIDLLEAAYGFSALGVGGAANCTRANRAPTSGSTNGTRPVSISNASAPRL